MKLSNLLSCSLKTIIEICMFTPGSMLVEDDTVAGDEAIEIGLNKDLERQICNAIDPRFLLQLVCLLKTTY